MDCNDNSKIIVTVTFTEISIDVFMDLQLISGICQGGFLKNIFIGCWGFVSNSRKLPRIDLFALNIFELSLESNI